MAIPSIAVDLCEYQIDRLKPIMDQVRRAEIAGAPGMALAQIFGDKIRVFFATNEQAADIQRAMGSPVGLTGRG